MSEYSGFGQNIAKSLITDAQSGDVAAMEAIYRTFCDPCFRLAYRMTNNKYLAQDVVHEVFIKVMKKIGKYQASGSFAGWIRQIAVNESIDFLKLNAKQQTHVELDDTIHSKGLFENSWWDACKDLGKLTARLSDDARAVLFLHELEGYSHKEIGQLFGKSESFSKQSLSRAFTQLKNMNAIKEIKNASL